MKAIETKYAGYRFRSRLEARWAVFLDALELEWDYEPEGIILPKGEWYLPDFYVHTTKTWLEIKPPEYSYEEKYKCMMLSLETGTHVIILNGTPDFKRYLGFYPFNVEKKSVFTLGYVLIPVEDRFSVACGWNDIQETYDSDGWPKQYQLAVREARSARFEHGERYD